MAVRVISSDSNKISKVNMNGGEISGNEQNTGAYAGGIMVNYNAVFTMNGGIIKENVGTDGNPGGILIAGAFTGNMTYGKFIMNQGEISGNSGDECGGGIQNYGYAELNGGEIKNNTAGWGAGVAVIGSGHTILNGTAISGNTASGNGAGVYVEGFDATGYDVGHGAVFEMKSGSITNNISEEGTGGGIFGYYWERETVIRISGGTISGNITTEQKLGAAISMSGESVAVGEYAQLELSGSPDISGDVLFANDNEDVPYQIKVTGIFTPAKQIEINRTDSTMSIPAVEYASGLTTDTKDFVSGSLYEALVVKDQKLIWAESKIVYFYDENGIEYEAYRHGVIIGEKIDASLTPAPTKAGYTLDGWEIKGKTEFWNFETDVMEKNTKLEESWKLNAPIISITADTENGHVGKTITMEAAVLHDAANLTYSYQWYKDNELLVGETGSTLSAADAGDYTVKVTASDGILTSAEAESAAAYTITAHNYTEVVTDPTCTEQGYNTHICSICQDSYIDSYVPAAGHNFGKWTVVKSPDCTNGGSEKCVCSVCGYAEIKDVAANGHEWEEDFTVDKEADCTSDGSKSIHCKHCDTIKESTVIPAVGHLPGAEWKSDAEQHWHECTVCGKKVDAAVHTFKWIVDKAASATEPGSKHEECAVCGYKRSAVTIPATGITGTDKPEPVPSNKPTAVPVKKPGTAVPKTGDDNNLMLYVGLLIIASGGLTGAALYGRKRKKH